MHRKRNLIVGIVVTAAAALTVLTTISTPGSESPATESPPETISPYAPAGLGNCSFQWAYQSATDLTVEFDAAVKEMASEASSHVEFFGENCVYADGTSTFGAMETDFYVRVQLEDLSDEGSLGSTISKVMGIVTGIPREKLQGPNYGFVEFVFEKSEAERIVIRVPIQQYLNEAKDLSDAELFQKFQTQP